MLALAEDSDSKASELAAVIAGMEAEQVDVRQEMRDYVGQRAPTPQYRELHSAAEVEQIVKATIAEVGATSKADLGKVMKAVQAKLAGRADNRLVSQTVLANLA